MAWPIVQYGGIDYYQGEGKFLVPVDPSTGAAIILLRHDGGIAGGFPAIEQGDPGDPALFQEGPISFTELAHDDPTPGGLSIVEVSPGLYTLTGALHGGEPGDDGSTSIDIETITGDAVAGRLLRLNTAADGFEFTPDKVSEVCRPVTLNNTAAGNANSTLGVAAIPSRPYDRRVIPFGYTIVTQNGGSNVVVDFYARLNGETGGNIVGICQGIGGTERLVLSPTPAVGVADTFDKVLANNAATVHFRTEQQGGANSYTTTTATTRAGCLVVPV